MGQPIKIVALPTNTRAQHGTGLRLQRDTYRLNHVANGHEFIPTFTSINDLWTKIRAICERNAPDVDCVTVLEISAHGSPDYIDGISDEFGNDNTDAFGLLVKQNKDILCDEVHMYCSGCNTGIDFGPWDSIAKNICDDIPFDATTFPYHVSVYGTKGYMYQGTSKMMGNEKVIAEGKNGNKVTHPSYWNGEDANGNNVWNKFDNW
ncbi:hypothetical protein [Hwangdonia lutea]|uniref:Uncharacterized protein n=1 Tax=Hwangdonia lutea TaxID=3075823 RepID=A0AA97ELY1_9FLAO|nr:hypothetical protein [Hwangdonia sp. SCSIO 19198]WOD43401.1 hypothetical protein RNZ46_15535 [Hwangdonia sp. SCSIO 19198]